METLAETSLPAGLRRTDPSSLMPTSPDGEQSPQNSNPGSMLANIIGTSPGGSSGAHNLLEDHSQSSQDDSGSMVSPVAQPEPEETIENIEKELSESCADTDSQPALEPPNTTVKAPPAGSGTGPGGASTTGSASAGQPEGAGAVTVANGGGTRTAKVAPSGGKPMAMRDFDRKITKPRRRPKPKARVAMYQSEVSLQKLE